MYEVELKVRAPHGPVRERLAAVDAEPLGAVEQVDIYYDHPVRSFAETDEALRIRRERPAAIDDSVFDHAGAENPGRNEAGRGDGDDDAGAQDDEADDGDDADDADADGGDDERAAVTYKGPLIEAESKTREEVESGIDDGEAMDAVLQHLGFEPAATVEKRRERFRVDGFVVALDDVVGLDEYVEVETPVERWDGATERVTDVDGQAGDPADTGSVRSESMTEPDATRFQSIEEAREGAIQLLESLGLNADDQLRTSYLGLLLEADP